MFGVQFPNLDNYKSYFFEEDDRRWKTSLNQSGRIKWRKNLGEVQFRQDGATSNAAQVVGPNGQIAIDGSGMPLYSQEWCLWPQVHLIWAFASYYVLIIIIKSVLYSTWSWTQPMGILAWLVTTLFKQWYHLPYSLLFLVLAMLYIRIFMLTSPISGFRLVGEEKKLEYQLNKFELIFID